MTKLLFIAIGGAAGTVARYVIGSALQRASGGVFPWGTLGVNLIGSFLIGLLSAVFAATIVSENLRLGLLVGLLGAFTTFSTFSLETVRLMQDRQYFAAAGNMLTSCVAGVALVFCGFLAARGALALIKG